ncbi:MAG: hypothetical protein QY310_04490 [Candidatus Jettenia sp. CY-1]|nr:MAG: hypothetical protein QY310_04490 [Candidatus Jettenia sp. CY-1]
MKRFKAALPRSAVTAAVNEGKLSDEHVAFIDFEEIYFELQKYKNERGYHNLNIKKNMLPVLLERIDWYVLCILEEELVFRSFDQVRLWQEIAITLLKKYCDHYYHAKQLDYEKDKMEYKYLDEVEAALEAQGKKGNIVDEYTFLVEKSRTDIIAKRKELKQKIGHHDFRDFEFRSLRSFSFDQHLYKPLIYIKDSEIKVMPVALNEGENQFVVDLRKYFEGNADFFHDKELYLLRNFILWLVVNGKQYINFIDPHGIRHAKGIDDPKIGFHKEIKTLENQIGGHDAILNSFIVSVTEFNQIKWWRKRLKKEDLERNNVVFQSKNDIGYIKEIFNILGFK